MSHHKKALTAEQIDDMINSGKLPQNTPGADWSLFESLTNSDVSSLTTSQDELQDITGTTSNPAAVAVEDFTGVSFTSMLNDFQGASGTLDNGNGAALQQISANIVNASDAFQQDLATQDALNQWVGKTHDAAIQNINQSLPDVTNIAMGANALGLLIDAFSHTIFQTQWYLLKNAGGYNESVSRWPNEIDEINQVYDSFAQDVMNTVYAPNITSIASNNPGFSTPASSTDSSSVPPPIPTPTPAPTPPPTPPPPTPPPLVTNDAGSGGAIPPPGDPLGDSGNTDLAGGSGNSAGGSGNFQLPTGAAGAGSGDFALPTGVPGAGSGDFALPTGAPGAGSGDFALPGGDSSDGSGDFPLPSGVPGDGSGDLALPGGDSSDGSGDFPSPTDVPGDGSGSFALPGGDPSAGGSGDFPLPSGVPGAGSSDFALPSGDSAAGSGNFPLPSAAGLSNSLGGSGGAFSGSGSPGAGLGGPTTPNGAGGNGAPLSDISEPSAGSGNLVPPNGSGASSPFGGSSGAAGGSGNPASGLSGLGQAAEGLGEPLQQALGAAQGHPGGMPGSGMPGPGPKDLDALGKPGGGGGHGAGAGAGLGPNGHDTLAPAGAPVAAANKGTPPSENALARPGGVPLGAGGSPGGAPPGGGGGGGQRGPGGKEHKPNKALRRKKNGEFVLGDVDAVVPVIGDDGPDEAEPPQRAPAPPVPQTPRPASAGAPRRPASEQRTEVGW